MAKVKMGVWYEVPNTQRRNGENSEYMAIKVENETGENERWLMFTKSEWERLPSIQLYSPGCENNGMKSGRLFTCCKNGINQFIMHSGGCLTLISFKKLAKAEERARKNQEDQPKQNWLEDLLD